MKLLLSEQGLSWRYGRKSIAVALPGAVSAVADTICRRVLAIVQSGDEHEEQLYAFSYSGNEIFRRSSPSDGRLSYLTTAPEQGALVVVNLHKPNGYWSDWHYAVDAAGELTPYSPAY